MPTQAELSERALGLKQGARREAIELQRRGYRIPDFCAAYGISRSQAYIEIAEGRLKLRKVGRRSLIAADDAEAWFAACAVAPKAA